MMLDSPRKRPWRVIADELVCEKDTRRILELSQELNDALEELITHKQRAGIPVSPVRDETSPILEH